MIAGPSPWPPRRLREEPWDSGIGRDSEKGKVGFKQLEAYTLKRGEAVNESGRPEFLENLINEFI
ncbi:MAG: hypothetical protein ACKODH_00890 [Limisphaerales bacterium]